MMMNERTDEKDQVRIDRSFYQNRIIDPNLGLTWKFKNKITKGQYMILND